MKNQHYIPLLLKARERIEFGSDRYICHAIMNSMAEPFSQVHYHKMLLRNYIQRQLGNHACYVGWIKSVHPKTFALMWTDDYRVGRMQWIDWLIANIETLDIDPPRAHYG